MTCRAARVLEDGGAHQLSFRAITPAEAAEGYCAKCEACGSRFKNALEWIVTNCQARPELAGRQAGG